MQANSLLYGTTDVLVGSEKPFTISFFAHSLSGSVHPCTLPDASFCAAKTSLLSRTTDIRVRSETTRREHKLTAGTPKNEHPCSFLGYKFAGANLLLLGTTAIRGGFDTSSIYFSSGMDAAGLNRSDVSASAETRHQKCTRMYTFDDATTQMPAYFQKNVLKNFYLYSIIPNCTGSTPQRAVMLS